MHQKLLSKCPVFISSGTGQQPKYTARMLETDFKPPHKPKTLRCIQQTVSEAKSYVLYTCFLEQQLL